MFGLIRACLWILALIVNGCSGLTSWVNSDGTTFTTFHICAGGPKAWRCWYNTGHHIQGCCFSGTHTSAECCVRCPMGTDLEHRCDDSSHERCCPLTPGYSTCCNSAGWTSYLSSSWSSSSRSSSLSSSLSSRLSYSSYYWSSVYSSRSYYSSLSLSSSYSSVCSRSSYYWSSMSYSASRSVRTSCSSELSDYRTESFSASLSLSRSYASVCSRSSRFWSDHFSTSCQSSRETVTTGCSNGGSTGATNGGSTGGSTGATNGDSTGGSSGGSTGATNGNSNGGSSGGQTAVTDPPPKTPCSNTGWYVGGALAGFFFLVMVVVAAVMGSQLAAHRSQSDKNSTKSPRRPLSGFENVVYNNQVPVGTSQEDTMNVYAELQLPPNGQSRY